MSKLDVSDLAFAVNVYCCDGACANVALPKLATSGYFSTGSSRDAMSCSFVSTGEPAATGLVSCAPGV